MAAKKLEAKNYIKLQEIAEEIKLESDDWDVLNDKFSASKTLFDYQMEALLNAIKILWKFFEDLKGDKRRFSELYDELDIYENLCIDLKNHKFSSVLKEFFETKKLNRKEVIPFRELSNRMSFWMATGSGKTLVIIKLIEILHTLMESGLIPKKEILFLTYREDLLRAFKEHVKEYNSYRSLKEQLHLISLKEYEKEAKQTSLSRRLFYYRSDLISDERKENILNFRDFLELDEKEKPFGNWYIILDEAHKGDTQDSKRQAIFSILSQKGFLFNFSATFTAPIDIVTTVYNMNLNEFIKKGYGKQVYILQNGASAFKNNEDFSKEEKRKIILKNFILLTTTKKAYKKIKNSPELFYHNPMSIFLVNSVNKKDSDLFLVFKEIENLGKNIKEEEFSIAKEELLHEFKEAKYILGEESYTLDFVNEILRTITIQDIYREVFNSESGGNIEYTVKKDNKQEILLKLDSSDQPFALIKIGNITKWINEKLIGYKFNDAFENESWFEKLNSLESSVNLLLGSRAFYEGWDSNRPNLITFINIGKGTKARKFVIQAIGRGIRIEPVKNERKRISKLSKNSNTLREEFKKHKSECLTLETLFVTATNKSAVETILTELDFVKRAEGFEEVSLWENERVSERPLYVPVYKRELKKILEEKTPPKFEMSRENLDFLKTYLKLIQKERFILEENFSFQEFAEFENVLKNHHKFIRLSSDKHYYNPKILIKHLRNHLRVEKEDVKDFSLAKEKIIHFRKIKIKTDYKAEFTQVAKKVKEAKFLTDDELYDMVISGEIDKEKFKKLKEQQEFIEQKIDSVKLRKLLQHFYVPIVFTQEKKDWIKHIIDVKSEAAFIENLLQIVEDLDNYYDWWMFSKLNEKFDEVYIPYIQQGKVKKFVPDFVFWFFKGDTCTIHFIDPKGTAYSDYQLKVDGYEMLFTKNGKEKIYKKQGLRIKVKLHLYTDKNLADIGEKYRNYWFDENRIFQILTEE